MLLARNGVLASGKRDRSYINIDLYSLGVDINATYVEPFSVFSSVVYVGAPAPLEVNVGGYSPDLVWIKRIASSSPIWVYDSLTGPNMPWQLNTTERTFNLTNGLTSFLPMGFSLGGNQTHNFNGIEHIAWCWKKAPESGLDIIEYTGTGALRSLNHNLGDEPEVIIVKRRGPSGNFAARYYSSSLGANTVLRLDDTASSSLGSEWGNTNPTNLSFTLGAANSVNADGFDYVAYIFRGIEGFSKFGTYTGAGISGSPFVECGFAPSMCIIKRSDSTGQGSIYTKSRGNTRIPTSSDVNEITSEIFVNFGQNGFSPAAGHPGLNGSNGVYFYMAWA